MLILAEQRLQLSSPSRPLTHIEEISVRSVIRLTFVLTALLWFASPTLVASL